MRRLCIAVLGWLRKIFTSHPDEELKERMTIW